MSIVIELTYSGELALKTWRRRCSVAAACGENVAAAKVAAANLETLAMCQHLAAENNVSISGLIMCRTGSISVAASSAEMARRMRLSAV